MASFKKWVVGIGMLALALNFIPSTSYIIPPAKREVLKEGARPALKKDPLLRKDKKDVAIIGLEGVLDYNDAIFSRIEELCQEEDPYYLTSMLKKKGDYESAIALCEDEEDYVCAAKAAMESGNLELAKEYLLMASEELPLPAGPDDYMARWEYSKIGEKYEEIGEYDKALEIYEKSGANYDLLELALELNNEALAKNAFEKIIKKGGLRDAFLSGLVGLETIKRLGYYDTYKELCPTDIISYICQKRIIYEEGTPAEILKFEIDNGNVSDALLLAKKYGLTTPFSESEIEEELEKEIDFTLVFSEEGVRKFKEFSTIGYADFLMEKLHGESESPERGNYAIRNLIEINKHLGNNEEVFSLYDRLPVGESYDAANYARKLGLHDLESAYLKKFLEAENPYAPLKEVFYTCWGGEDCNLKDPTNHAEAMTRLGDLEGALSYCESIPDKCKCAYYGIFSVLTDEEEY